jgi:ribosomal protein S18 acetylase RimI-like enzyme
MIKVQFIKEDRWKEHKKLRLEALKSDPIAFGSSYSKEKKLSEKEWKRRTKNALFAIFDNELIGMTIIIFEKGQKIKHIANIYGVYVKKKFRGQGISKKIFDEAIKIIKKKKYIKKIKLTVNSKQKPAINLYKKYGFKEVGVFRKELKINNKFYDSIVMEKHL